MRSAHKVGLLCLIRFCIRRKMQSTQKKAVKSVAFKGKKKKKADAATEKALAIADRLDTHVQKRDAKECAQIGRAGRCVRGAAAMHGRRIARIDARPRPNTHLQHRRGRINSGDDRSQPSKQRRVIFVAAHFLFYLDTWICFNFVLEILLVRYHQTQTN